MRFIEFRLAVLRWSRESNAITAKSWAKGVSLAQQTLDTACKCRHLEASKSFPRTAVATA